MPNNFYESRVTPKKGQAYCSFRLLSWPTPSSGTDLDVRKQHSTYPRCAWFVRGSQFHVNNFSFSEAFRPLFREGLYLLMAKTSLNNYCSFLVESPKILWVSYLSKGFTDSRYKPSVNGVLTVACRIVPVLLIFCSFYSLWQLQNNIPWNAIKPLVEV